MTVHMCMVGRLTRDCNEEPFSNLLAFPDEILEKVIELVDRPEDRNVISLVCKRLNYLEGNTRHTVLVSNCYGIRPLTLASRFPNARSITIKGKPRIVDFSLIPHSELWGAYATPWVEILTRNYKTLTHLRLKRMFITDTDIALLVSVCGESLRSLELEKCIGFSTAGLLSIARTCRNLIFLNLAEAVVHSYGAIQWLTTLAETAKSLQVLDMSLTELADVDMNSLANLATRCHTLRLTESLQVDRVLPILQAAANTVCHLGIGLYSQMDENPDQVAEAFGRCKGLRDISGLWDFDEGSVRVLMPIASRLTRLDLTYALLGEAEVCELLSTCFNLEDLQATDIIGDSGLQVLGSCCKLMRRLVVQQDDAGFVSQHGLMAVAKGCSLLEKIIIYAADMTNEALETLAINCPDLKDIRICLVQKYNPSHPVIELEGKSTLNDGIKAILMQCPKARRLALCFSRFGLSNSVINDEGMRHIGEYGGNLHIITLTNCGFSDAGLAFIAVGCVKLRKLELRHCPFGDSSMAMLALGCPCLRSLWVQACKVTTQGVRLLAQRPDLIVEVVMESINADGTLVPWQLIAYGSVAPPRKDLPYNISHVGKDFNTCLSNEEFLCPSTIIDEVDE